MRKNVKVDAVIAANSRLPSQFRQSDVRKSGNTVGNSLLIFIFFFFVSRYLNGKYLTLKIYTLRNTKGYRFKIFHDSAYARHQSIQY